MVLSITIMPWDNFIKVVTYPFKIIFGVLNVHNTIELAPGITVVDLEIFVIMVSIITGFILIQSKGR